MAIAGFALFIFGVGVILVIVAPIGKRKNNRCSAQTQGTLREIRGRYNSDGSLHGMHVYAYFVDGIEYQLKSTAVNPHVHNVGDSCPIWYDPKNPKVALEYHYRSNKLFNILLVVGVVLILLGLVLPFLGLAFQAS